MQSQKNRWTLFVLGLAVVALAAIACGGDEATTEPNDDANDQPGGQTPTSQQIDTPTPIPTEAADNVSGQQGRALAALSAVDAIDSAGFHDMAKALAESEEINPRFAGTVSKVLTVAEATAWDDALEAESRALVTSLETLLAALEREDLEASRAAAEEIHDTQHDLSKATYAWLKTVAPVDGADSDTATLSVIAAIDVIDSAGFHDMTKDLASSTEINPRYAGTVDRALTAATLAAWNDEIATPASKLTADLQELYAALEAGDLAAAAAAAEAVHDSQHDTSKAAYAWLATNHPMMNHEDTVLATACEIKAVDAVDSVGFHDMAKDLAEATEINPRYAGKISNALAVLAFEPDSEGGAMMHALSGQMTELHDALAAEDLESARELAEAVHDAQHDFSHEMYGRMVAMHGTE